MSTYRHPPIDVSIQNATYTSEGRLQTASENMEADQRLEALIRELKMNNLYNSLNSDVVIKETEV